MKRWMTYLARRPRVHFRHVSSSAGGKRFRGKRGLERFIPPCSTSIFWRLAWRRLDHPPDQKWRQRPAAISETAVVPGAEASGVAVAVEVGGLDREAAFIPEGSGQDAGVASPRGGLSAEPAGGGEKTGGDAEAHAHAAADNEDGGAVQDDDHEPESTVAREASVTSVSRAGSQASEPNEEDGAEQEAPSRPRSGTVSLCSGTSEWRLERSGLLRGTKSPVSVASSTTSIARTSVLGDLGGRSDRSACSSPGSVTAGKSGGRRRSLLPLRVGAPPPSSPKTTPAESMLSSRLSLPSLTPRARASPVHIQISRGCRSVEHVRVNAAAATAPPLLPLQLRPDRTPLTVRRVHSHENSSGRGTDAGGERPAAAPCSPVTAPPLSPVRRGARPPSSPRGSADPVGGSQPVTADATARLARTLEAHAAQAGFYKTVRAKKWTAEAAVGADSCTPRGGSPRDCENRARLEQLFYGDMAVRLSVEPAAAVLGLCCPGLPRSSEAVVVNRGRVAVSLAVGAPGELRRHFRVRPAALRLRPGERRRLQLQLCARQSFSRDAQKFTCRLSGVTQFPVKIVALSKSASAHPELSVQVLAAVSPPVLEVTPATLHLGSVLTRVDSATAHVSLANRSLMTQQYGFVNLPEELRVEPGGGFGEIRAGEVVDLAVVFSPVGAEGPRQFTLHVETVLGLATRSAQAKGRRSRARGGGVQKNKGKPPASGAHACALTVAADVLAPRVQFSAHRVRFPPTPVGAHSTAELTMTCTCAEARFAFKTPDGPVQVIPPSGSLVQGQCLRVLLLYLPKPGDLEHAAGEAEAQGDARQPHEVRVLCEAEARLRCHADWRRESIPVLALCRAEPASLKPVSQAVAFDAVAVGCSAQLRVHFQNTSASWLRVRPASPNPRAGGEGFSWPILPVLLPPGHDLHLPVTFAPAQERPKVHEVMELQYTAEEGPVSACLGFEETAPGAAVVQLTGSAVDAQYHIVPDAVVVRLSARRRPRRQHGTLSTASSDGRDRATLRIRNTCSAPLEFTVANVRAFDLGPWRPEDGGDDDVDQTATTASNRVDAPKVSKAMTASEQVALQRRDALRALVGGVGVGPFHLAPEPERASAVAPGGHLPLCVRFAPPSFANQYVATFELRLGGGDSAATIRQITCFGNVSPGSAIPP